MVNWKSKYLEDKLKYINAKQKAGAGGDEECGDMTQWRRNWDDNMTNITAILNGPNRAARIKRCRDMLIRMQSDLNKCKGKIPQDKFDEYESQLNAYINRYDAWRPSGSQPVPPPPAPTPVPRPTPTPVPRPAPTPVPRQFNTGVRVEIHGIRARPELNGKTGTITGFEDGRYYVNVPGEPNRLHLREINLKDAPLPSGTGSAPRTPWGWTGPQRVFPDQMREEERRWVREGLLINDLTSEQKRYLFENYPITPADWDEYVIRMRDRTGGYRAFPEELGEEERTWVQRGLLSTLLNSEQKRYLFSKYPITNEMWDEYVLEMSRLYWGR